MSGLKLRPGRRPRIPVPDSQRTRMQIVLGQLPGPEEEIGATELIDRLTSRGASRATAIRRINEAVRSRFLEKREEGRRRFYRFAWRGFMTGPEAEGFLHGAPVTFLKHAPKLVADYQDSLSAMTLYWKQSSSAFAMSMWSLISAAQSISFSQDEGEPMPSVDVARRQAEVLVDAMVKPWVVGMISSLHSFLRNERAKNRVTPRQSDGRLTAPSAMAAYKGGWDWLRKAASEEWQPIMKAGPWGEFIARVVAEQEAKIRAELGPPEGTL